MATNAGKYPAEYIAVGRLRSPHPNAVPHNKADEERKLLVSAGLALAMMTVVVVATDVFGAAPSGSVAIVDDWFECCTIIICCWTVVVSYCKFENSCGTSPLRYSGEETIRDSSIFPTLSISVCSMGGTDGEMDADDGGEECGCCSSIEKLMPSDDDAESEDNGPCCGASIIDDGVVVTLYCCSSDDLKLGILIIILVLVVERRHCIAAAEASAGCLNNPWDDDDDDGARRCLVNKVG